MDGCCNLLPGDLRIEILGRLPVKSLMRFKCVGKTWRSLILSPSFITLHLNINNKEVVSHYLLHSCHFDLGKNHIYSIFNDVATDLHIPFQFTSTLMDSIVGCSNGLVCIQISPNDEPHFAFVAWNPATREFRHLPRPQIGIDPTHGYLSNCCGFSFLPRIGDYKLVKIIISDGRTTAIVESFTWSSNSWRVVNHAAVLPCKFIKCPRVLLKGSLYWMGTGIENNDQNGRRFSNELPVVVCFDMTEEKFRQIMVPSCPDYQRYYFKYPTGSLTVFKESLAMIVFNLNDETDTSYDVWVMSDYDGSWSKQLSIGYSFVDDHEYFGHPKGFWLNEEVIIFDDRIDPENVETEVLCLYEPHTKEVKSFPSIEGEFGGNLYPYAESLLSP